MSKKLNIIIFVSIFCCFLPLAGQDPTERIWSEIDSLMSCCQEPMTMKQTKMSKWSSQTTVGTSFSYAPGFGSAMTMMLAPQYAYSATQRLKFHGGLVASHTTLGAFLADETLPSYQGLNHLSVFVAASYQLTENFFIHGTGIRSLMTFPGEFNHSNINFDDISVGATYRIGNFSIGASLHRSQNIFGALPFGYGHNIYGSPLYW